MLGVRLSNKPVPVPGAPGLSVLNIDPDVAAEAYRLRVLAQLKTSASEDERATVREQLSGACTTEIAAFDEFAALLLTNEKRKGKDKLRITIMSFSTPPPLATPCAC